MLFPQTNAYRQFFDLSGLWEFRFDPDDNGRERGWESGFPLAAGNVQRRVPGGADHGQLELL